jgi:hypothetical protein
VLVVHTYNPNYLGGLDWEDHGSKPAWANSSLAPISTSGCCIPVILSYTWRPRSGGSKFQVSLGKKRDPISKITRTKGDGGVAQAEEHLPSKH